MNGKLATRSRLGGDDESQSNDNSWSALMIAGFQIDLCTLRILGQRAGVRVQRISDLGLNRKAMN